MRLGAGAGGPPSPSGAPGVPGVDASGVDLEGCVQRYGEGEAEEKLGESRDIKNHHTTTLLIACVKASFVEITL